MKFCVDAQLPRRLATWFRAAGFKAIHTLDLPNGNRTSDAEIDALSIREQYVVVTKDADFVNSFHLTHQSNKTDATIRNVMHSHRGLGAVSELRLHKERREPSLSV